MLIRKPLLIEYPNNFDMIWPIVMIFFFSIKELIMFLFVRIYFFYNSIYKKSPNLSKVNDF